MKSWLPADLDARIVTLITSMFDDLGEHEVPAHSNCGPLPDAVNAEFGSPLGSSWCGNYQGSRWRRAGLDIPAIPGVCRHWHLWALSTRRLAPRPTLGSAALFGDHPDAAHHVALVVCLDPLLIIGGNQSWSGYTVNGEAVTLRPLDMTKLLAYVRPVAGDVS